MDFKKLLKSLGVSDQFTFKKSKVFSGFGLGVIASVLLLTVFFLNYPVKVSLLYPVFQGFNGISSKSPLPGSWPFQKSTTSSNSTNGERSNNATSPHVGISSELSQNSSLIDSRGGTLVSEKSQTGNLSSSEKNSSFVDSGGGKLVSEKPQSGNLAGREKNSSFIDSRGGNNSSKTEKDSSFVDSRGGDKSNSGNLSGGEKNSTLFSEEAAKVSEKPQQGNMSKEVNSTKNSTKEVSEVKSVENNGSFIGYSVGFADKGTDRNNATIVPESVKANGSKETVLGKPHEQNSPDKSKTSSSSDGSGVSNDFAKCDIFDGRWVRDEAKPYYPAGSCPYIDRDFDCHRNGRPDSDFVKWRWQPNHCDIPSLNATNFLERLRGKRLVFVGDSLNRNMWESLVCILRHSVADKKKVFEISGKKEFKKKGFYAFHFQDFNCSIDFVSSPFLVRETPIKSKNGLTETLRLDLMDRTAPMYHDADVIVFNTGHWWTHEKTSKGENYYQEGNHVYPRLKVMEAYTKALKTWARWIDKNVDDHKSQLFFRGYSVTHFRGGQWNSGGQCHKETEPIYNETHLAKYPSKMRALENVLQQMKTPVTYLNISKLTDYRKDAHPSIYRKEYKTAAEKHAAEGSQDCSHWCLPGVPDTWNELLYASLLKVGRGSWGN